MSEKPAPRSGLPRARRNEQMFSGIFECALDALLLADDAGVYLDANPSACALFGVPRERLVGRNIADFADPTLDMQAAWQVFLREGRSEGEFLLVRPDGVRRELEFRAVANIQPGIHLSVLRDVTERNRATAKQAQLAAIVESSEYAIVSSGLPGSIDSWNRGAERLYQWTAAEALGRPLSWLVPPQLLAAEQLALERCLRGEPVVDYDTRRLRKDGSLVDVALTLSPIRDQSGAIVGISKIARDLSAQRSAEEQLQRSQEQLRQAQKMEAIGVLAGGVAHDFNNLLSVALSYGHLVHQDLAQDNPVRADVAEILRACERATGLTQQLLAFSRQQVLQPRVLDLGEVVQAMVTMLRRVLSEDIELCLSTTAGLGRVHADRSQLEQIVMNLVVNPRDAMPLGGRLGVDIRNGTIEHGAYVVLTITDTGSGMDRATRERIFEPFFTTKEKGKGTGLGLSTVFGIVQQSQGHIRVDSEPGRGARFEIFLPRTDLELEPGRDGRVPSTLRGSETILLVEDDAQVRAATRAILVRYGYQVIAAANSGEALVLCETRAGDIQLLLTDVVMPRMSGYELANRLLAIKPDLRVLYVSGYTENAIGQHGVLAGTIAYLAKPFTPESLCRKIREVLE